MNNLTLGDDLLAKSSWKVPKFRDFWRGEEGEFLSVLERRLRYFWCVWCCLAESKKRREKRSDS